MLTSLQADGRVLQLHGDESFGLEREPCTTWNAWFFDWRSSSEVYVKCARNGHFIRGLWYKAEDVGSRNDKQVLACRSTEIPLPRPTLIRDLQPVRVLDRYLPMKIQPLPGVAKFKLAPPIDQYWPTGGIKHWLWSQEFSLSDQNIVGYNGNPRRIEDYYYTTQPSGEGAVEAGYDFQRIVGYVYPDSKPNTKLVNRYYQNGSTIHFYTQDEGGEGVQANGWHHEGIKFYLPTTEENGSVPLYRNRQSTNGNYYYTPDPTTPNGYSRQQNLERIFPTQVEGSVPLFQWYRPNFP